MGDIVKKWVIIVMIKCRQQNKSVETIFTQSLMVNLTNNYKEMENNTLNYNKYVLSMEKLK